MAQEPSKWEMLFETLWEERHESIELFAEYYFMAKRKFRLDFAHPGTKVGVEIQGQIWVKGRHNTGHGLLSSYEKLNHAASLGWVCFQLAPKQITAEWLQIIADCILSKQKDQKHCDQK